MMEEEDQLVVRTNYRSTVAIEDPHRNHPLLEILEDKFACRITMILVFQIVQTAIMFFILVCLIFAVIMGWKFYVYASDLSFGISDNQFLCFVVRLLGDTCPKNSTKIDF